MNDAIDTGIMALMVAFLLVLAGLSALLALLDRDRSLDFAVRTGFYLVLAGLLYWAGT